MARAGWRSLMKISSQSERQLASNCKELFQNRSQYIGERPFNCNIYALFRFYLNSILLRSWLQLVCALQIKAGFATGA